MAASTEAVVSLVRSYGPLVRKIAEQAGVSASVLAGLVCQESQGKTWASRPEPFYRWIWGGKSSTLPLLKRLLPNWRTPEQDHYMQRVSWGLCQVMGAVAREAGMGGYLTQLCDPATGLHYGAGHLALCIRRAGGNVYGGLRRYNGNPESPKTAKYADAVLAWASYFKDWSK